MSICDSSGGGSGTARGGRSSSAHGSRREALKQAEEEGYVGVAAQGQLVELRGTRRPRCRPSPLT